jgi:hypothetical protein
LNEVCLIKCKQIGNAVNLHCSYKSSVVRAFAPSFVPHDEIEPDTKNFVRVREQAESVTQLNDRLLGNADFQSKTV